ncbi:MAG: E3 binding domain-containing protein, partial [Congregibacter sp.]|nr:E3 binding domain-containing protein [Congregibacter sp.]
MAIQIKAPSFPESVADGEVAAWHKKEGDSVQRDELIVEIETDKVVMEVVAPEDGVLKKIHAPVGETIESEALLAELEPGAVTATVTDSAFPAPAAVAATADADATAGEMGPAARQMVQEHGLDAAAIKGTGKGGRVTKEDVAAFIKDRPAATAVAAKADDSSGAAIVEVPSGPSGERIEKRVPMTRMRARIAERLLEASTSTAMLTTFNEVNMAPVMA